jgi:two-component system, LuxR family, sensor kinase FixL
VEAGVANSKSMDGRLAWRNLVPALRIAACYFLAAELGAAMALAPAPLPALHPAGAVLLAALLASPGRLWPPILLLAVPAHLLAQLPYGLSFDVALAGLLGNAGLALLGAAGISWLLRGRLRLGLLHHAVVFVCWGALAAPALAALPEIVFQRAAGAAAGPFWQDWLLRAVARAALVLAIVPPCLHLNVLRRIISAPWKRQCEGAVLLLLLVAGAAVAFSGEGRPRVWAALAVYAPLPLLCWAAVRFSPWVAQAFFLLYSMLAVAGTAAGAGPFAADAGGLPLLLYAVAVPLLLLSAAVQERRGTLASLRAGQDELGQALLADRNREDRLAGERRARAEVELRIAQRSSELRAASAQLRTEIAARQRALESERIAAARFANLFRLGPDAMAISSAVDGPLLDVNERWQQLFGYTRDEVLGRRAAALDVYANPADAAAITAALAGQDVVQPRAVCMRSREGNVLQIMFSGARIAGRGDSCFLSVLRDVTEQRTAEAEAARQREQLAHLTRVVVLGELSGALAHELNQPLAAILANAQAGLRFLSRPTADLGEVREILQDIATEDKRAGDVIRRLRALFKKEAPERRTLDLGELVKETLDLTHSILVERNVSVRLTLEDSLLVCGDRVQLQQVLLNLIINGCDAMRQSGPARRCLCMASTRLPDGQVEVTVADSGPGIAPDVIDKVFDPLFTTKPEGLGFGLSISRAIVAQHGGRIEAANLAGGGCVFRVQLPASLGEHDE